MGIYKEEINGKKMKLAKEVLHLEKYDMYYVEFPMKDGTIRKVRVFCEKGTFPDRESEQFKEYQRRYRKELITFFVNRLVGTGSLMEEQRREDYIYLGGEFMQNGYIANRFMIQSNGKTGQENFDANLFKIKQQVLAMENTKNNYSKNIAGKNYVCSDIHGMYEEYEKAINFLQPEDVLWVLGDAEDRGYDGIPILLDIISRSGENGKNPQVRYVFGNHDLMLLQCIEALQKAGMTNSEMNEYYEAFNILRDLFNAKDRWNMTEDEARKIIEKYGGQKEKRERQKKALEDKMGKECLSILRHGLNNDNDVTLEDYFKLTEEEQARIVNFLKNSPLFITRQFGDKKVALVHAAPPEMEPKTGISITYNDIINSGKSQEEIESFINSIVWERRGNGTALERFKKWHNAGYTTIYGHTPTASKKLERHRVDGSIAVDTDSCYNGLSLYCIEENRAKYFGSKENELNSIEPNQDGESR